MKKQILFILLILSTTLNTITQKGIICVPVADLIGQPLTNNQYTSYKTLPECPAKGSLACPRLHQALFNEVVNVLKEKEDEIQIQIHNCFYTTYNSEKKQSTYWTQKKNVLLFSELTNKDISIQNTIPEPINYIDTTHHGLHNNNIIGLKEPHYDEALNMHFSVGTRFLLAQQYPHKRNTWRVNIINPTTLQLTTIHIPKYKCIRQQKNASYEQKIALFVDILKSWSAQEKGVIPYVWGGCSFVNPINGVFSTQTTLNHAYYTYQTENAKPKTGFDCAGLILRAAQLAGLEYFYKNTTTIAKELNNITTKEIRVGDIIFVPGHVMVVADTQKNALIEARGYDHGYGKVQNIALNEVFKAVDSYQILISQYFTQSPIIRIDQNAIERNVFAHYKLLRI